MRKNIIYVTIIVLLGLLSACSKTDDKVERSYKPMLKVGSAIYYWNCDVDMNIENLEKIGQVEKSYATLKKSVKLNDDDFTANVSKVGSEIYKIDDESVLLVGDNYKSIFKKITDKTKVTYYKFKAKS